MKGLQPGGGLPPGPAAQAAGSGVVLNFEGADLREVVRNILGDILNETYTIDPAVGGTVTIRTSSGIPRDALPATLETLLRMNGATMVKSGGIYMVVPQAAAIRGNITPQLGNSTRSLPPGFSVQIVPLRYVGVREMLRLLEPFAKDAQAVRPDELRNMLVLSGTERELRHLMDTIDMFDIDWMAGMSAGVFTLQNSDVKQVMTELEKIVGDRNASPITGILKIVPIERMNALLVVTPQPAYLDEVKKWIDRLDRASETGGGLQFYVYHLQNTRAERLAPLLQQAFTGRVTQQAAAAAPTLAPGTPAGTIVNPPAFNPQPLVNVVPPATPVAAAAPPADRRGGGGHRHRPQPAGGGRQGQQHAAAGRHAGRVLGHRRGAEAARHSATPGGHRRHDRPDPADGRAQLRRRVAVQGRSAVGPWVGRTGQRNAHQQAGCCQRCRLRPIRRLRRSSRASRTSSTTPISRAASRRRSICSTPTAAPRSSPTRRWRRSTTRRPRSSRGSASRSTSRRSLAARPTP